MSENLYDILGVSKDADGYEIKKAYRNKAWQHHPDAGGNSDDFQEVNNAYAVLVDPERRKRYDETGRHDDEDSIKKRQISELVGMVLEAVECLDHDSDDIFEAVRKRLRHFIDQYESAKKNLIMQARKFDRAAKRVKRKTDGENLFAAALETQAHNCRKNCETLDEKINGNRGMMAMLDDYEWQMEKPTPGPRQYRSIAEFLQAEAMR